MAPIIDHSDIGSMAWIFFIFCGLFSFIFGKFIDWASKEFY